MTRFFELDYVERAFLRDGTAVQLRLVTPDDKALLRRGFEGLSSKSRYARFLAPKQELSDDELRYLTELDGESHFAIGAVREAGDGAGEAVGLGLARFIRLADPRVAEAAIAVADEVQGQGLGKLLFLRLVAAAAERGIATFHCELLGSNASMLELIHLVSAENVVVVESGVMSIDLPLPNVVATQPPEEPIPTNAMYRLFKHAAENALEWTDAFLDLWRHRK